MTDYVLVLYYSKYGSTRQLAHLIAEGIEQQGLTARIRTVPEVASVTTLKEPSIPEQGELYCELEDLRQCAGLALGSPTRFGNMAAPLKFFLDQTSSLWLAGDLQGKPACVFTATSTQHGGQESTLLSMINPLLHHGMLIMGLPYSNAALSSTQRGGTPYGASHVSGSNHDQPLSTEEKQLCIAQGIRLAQLSKALTAQAYIQ